MGDRLLHEWRPIQEGGWECEHCPAEGRVEGECPARLRTALDEANTRATEMHRRAQQAEATVEERYRPDLRELAHLRECWRAAREWTESVDLRAEWAADPRSPFWAMASGYMRAALAVLVAERDEARAEVVELQELCADLGAGLDQAHAAGVAGGRRLEREAIITICKVHQEPWDEDSDEVTDSIATEVEMSFKPCSPNCPAVTGKPVGGVQYCAKQELERHRRPLPDGAGPERHRRGSHWYRTDWRTGKEVEVELVDHGDGFCSFDDPVPLHPDYTDCCADFGCCMDLAEKAGLAHIFAALAMTVEEGGGVVYVGDPPELPETPEG